MNADKQTAAALRECASILDAAPIKGATMHLYDEAREYAEGQTRMTDAEIEAAARFHFFGEGEG